MHAFAVLALSAGIATAAVFSPSAARAQEPLQPAIESSKTYGPYEILYTVVPTTFVSEPVAASYQIVRARDQAMVNVSVRKKVDDGDIAHAVVVKGTYSDLMQSRALNFREVREKDAIYYIAAFRHGDKEFLRFDLSVQVDSNMPAQTITFTRKLFVDE